MAPVSDLLVSPMARALLAALRDALPLLFLGAGVLLAAFFQWRFRRSGFAAISALLAVTIAFLLLWRMRHAAAHGGENLLTLLVVYLLPAALLATARRLLGKPAAAAAAIVGTVRDLALLLAVTVAVLVLNGLATAVPGHALLFAGLRLSVWLSLALAIDTLARDRRAPAVARWLVFVPLLPAAEPLVALLPGSANPLFSGEDVGLLPIANALLPAYLLPAVLFARLARRRAGGRPFALPTGAAALLFLFAWGALELRRAFHGAVLSGPTEEAEGTVYLLLGAIPMVVAALVLVFGRRRRRTQDQLSS